MCPVTQAITLDWKGAYRATLLDANNVGLDSQKSSKSVWLHNFDLFPEVIVNDTLRIHSGWTLTPSGIPGGQMGVAFGRTAQDRLGAGRSEINPPQNAALSEAGLESMIGVRYLYADWIQEFGRFRVGRQPFDFGLGMQFNSGFLGDFENWYEVFEGLSYQWTYGQFQVELMLARPYSGFYEGDSNVEDQLITLHYDGKSSGVLIGGLFRQRDARNPQLKNPADTSQTVTTLPTGFAGDGDPATVQTGGLRLQDYLFFVKSTDESLFQYGLEVGFQSGNLGITNQDGTLVTAEGFGAVTEWSYGLGKLDWSFQLLAGLASGDDPNTPQTFEGYVLDRNYDVAFLMMNHPLGNSSQLMGTRPFRPNPSLSPNRVFDEDRIGNLAYFSPQVNWKALDTLSLKLSLTTAQILVDPTNGNSSPFGTELDLQVIYQPNDSFTWRTVLGYFAPGGENLGTGATVGIQTQAAIRF